MNNNVVHIDFGGLSSSDLPADNPSEDHLKSGGGGGTFDGMEPRVRQLETDMSFIKGKLEDMPTKDWMNTRLLAYFGVALGIIGLMVKFL